MIKIFKDIVHKLWMVDHHKNEPEHIQEIFNKVHYVWLRENLQQLNVESTHITIENLREFAVETLLKNGVIYNYNPSPQKCLTPVKIDQCEMRDFAGETLEKKGTVANVSDLEKISEMRDFAEETLEKNGTEAVSVKPEIICESRDFAGDTLPKNGTEANLTTDTLSDPNLKNIFLPENKAIFDADAREKILCITDPKIIKKTAIVQNNCPIFFYYFFENKTKNFILLNLFKNFEKQVLYVRFDQFWSRTGHSLVQTNLGGRGHRFALTLESRISRYKIIIISFLESEGY